MMGKKISKMSLKKHKKKTKFIRKQSNKNREIIVLSVVFTGVFLAMIGYLCVYVRDNEQNLMNNSYNARQAILASENSRGTIYDRNGERLAYTESDGESEKRVYPHANLFSHVVGFSTKGKTGIEALSNYYLINSDIPLSQKVENDLAQRKNPGNEVHTTLDADLQKVVYDSLGIYKSACVVTNVKTGEILAMVSKPDFDPNTIVQDWDKFVEEEHTKKSSVLLNRVTQGLYPPGSTFKMITSLQYIREHNTSVDNYQFICNGRFSHGDTTIQCYHGANHGSEDFHKAFAKSCNSAFSSIGVGLDRNSYGNTLNELLFNNELPLDINYSKSVLTVDDSVSDDEMIQISIGQGKAQITPMHMNMITCAIANDGLLMKPRFVNRVLSANGNIVKLYQDQSYAQLLTKEESDILTELMIGVVNEGTATKLKTDTYQAAGKTGSAEYNGVKEDSHAWFTGFAPAEDPEIAVTIIIEGIGSGGDYAAPIAKRIFDAYFAE